MEKAITHPRTGSRIRSSKVANRRGEMRAKLMGAGTRLFVRHGIASVSVEDLIDEAGISRATFYGFFSNKNELAAAILMPVFETGIDALNQLQHLAPHDMAEGIIRVYLDLWREYEDALLLTGFLDGNVFPYFEKQHDAFNSGLLKLLRKIEAGGILKNKSAELTLEVLAKTGIPLLRIYKDQAEFDALYRDSILSLIVAASIDLP